VKPICSIRSAGYSARRRGNGSFPRYLFHEPDSKDTMTPISSEYQVKWKGIPGDGLDELPAADGTRSFSRGSRFCIITMAK
jgi:hypothetical protein